MVVKKKTQVDINIRDDPGTLYSVGLQWTILTLTIGMPDPLPSTFEERIFSIVMAIMAVCVVSQAAQALPKFLTSSAFLSSKVKEFFLFCSGNKQISSSCVSNTYDPSIFSFIQPSYDPSK